ncbi:outer-membrane receptor for ferric coprogen and ferric-rhodotorulic acid [Marinobacter daqiaonensis]|uniref:Outer-membrane receptor for ferric coprogen and ferric-rhodotorulic acid n=1 Tax=Marinobacter daqiaonensis TaxID=650891 RepID=A0A1I6HNM3_9GAMM|nr:TonB-dependent siderophore receptor [Marinobacter daqiaonensis]SFR56018.1 outer-membrane receptor for ferric coprogen and ferric-rhodotorulic acid [Marinobacter daqiaonensis]
MSMRKGITAGYLVAACFSGTAISAEQNPSDSDSRENAASLPTLEVTGAELKDYQDTDETYLPETSKAATGLTLSQKETPQAISVVTRERIEDFQLNNINSAFRDVNGVTVESVETDRTYFTSRGFDIRNFQFDGVNMPLVRDNIVGDLDTAPYDRIEVVRGATGLLTGTGDPSAAVNFVRKRPTGKNEGGIDLTYGSWNDARIEADASVGTGAVQGRVAVASQDRDSYLDRYEMKKDAFHAVIEGHLSPQTILTAGFTYQESNADSPLWGALPLTYVDGSQVDYSRDTSTSAEWSFWNTERRNAFVELVHTLDNQWQIKGVMTRIENTSDAKLFYVYEDLTTPEPELLAYPSLYEYDNDMRIFDLSASGPYQLFGRTHEAVIGANYSRSDLFDLSHYGRGIGTELVGDQPFDGSYPEPQFDAFQNGSDWKDEWKSLYGASWFNVTNRFKAIAGARLTSFDSEGASYGVSTNTSVDDEVTPFLGLVYDVTPNISAYASYADIFEPQTEVDLSGDRLDPITGQTVEAGLKSEWFGNRFYAAMAVFQTEEDNVAEQAGLIPGTALPFFTGVKGLESEGFEIDLAGEPLQGLELAGGFTYVNIEQDGNDALTYIPSRMARVSAVYELPPVQGLKVGASVNWQDDIEETAPAGGRVEQESYALLDLMARYEFNENWAVQANAFNVTDEKYLASLRWAGSSGQGFYGAPANGSVTLSWNY